MSLMKKMAKIIKSDLAKKANSIDYTKTYKKIYLDENNKPIYKTILKDLLGYAKKVKKTEDREEFFKSPDVGHFYGGVDTSSTIVKTVPVSIVLVDSYQDNLEGLYEYIQNDKASKIVEEDFKYDIDCEETDLQSIDVSIDWNEKTNIITFKCNYVCATTDKR